MRKRHFSLIFILTFIPLCPAIMSLYSIFSGSQIDYGYNETKDIFVVSLFVFGVLFCLFMMFVFAPYLITSHEDRVVFHYPLWPNKTVKFEDVEKLILVKNGLNEDYCTGILMKDGTKIKIKSLYFGLNKYLLALDKTTNVSMNSNKLSSEEKEQLFKQYNVEYKPNAVELIFSPWNLSALFMIILLSYRMFLLSSINIIFVIFFIGWVFFILQKLTIIRICDNKLTVSNIIFAGKKEFVLSELSSAHLDRKSICLTDKDGKKHFFFHALKKVNREELENLFLQI